MEKQAAFEKIAQVRAKLMLKGAYEAGVRDGMAKVAAENKELQTQIWNDPQYQNLTDRATTFVAKDRVGRARGSQSRPLLGGLLSSRGDNPPGYAPAYDAEVEHQKKMMARYLDPTRSTEDRVRAMRTANAGLRAPSTDWSKIKGPSYWESFKRTYGLN